MSEPSGGPPGLRTRRLGKTFAGVPALCEVDLVIQRGEIHALLGENGSGKSTLIKVLAGYHEPDEGSEVWVDGEPLTLGSPADSRRRGCRFVHQDLALVEGLTVLDNLFLGRGFPRRRLVQVDTVRARGEARAALGRVGLADLVDRPVVELSPAERTGVALARAMLTESGEEISLLVLDEPTATLPATEVDQLLAMVRTIAAGGAAVLYVSHRLAEVVAVADRVTVLRDGRRVADEPVGGLRESDLVTLLLGEEWIEPAPAMTEDIHGDPVLVASGLRDEVVAAADLAVRRGEVVGIAGITGSGREQLLPMLFGAKPRAAGRVEVAGRALRAGRPDQALRAGVVLVPSDRKRQGGFADLRARENVCAGPATGRTRWRVSTRRDRRETRTWMTALNVRPGGRTELPFVKFSGGNQQKLVLARQLRRTPQVLLLDEPTQGVDIGAKRLIHEQIAACAHDGMAVLVSSSDSEELAAVCSRVLVMREGRVADVLTGPNLTVTRLDRLCLAPVGSAPRKEHAS